MKKKLLTWVLLLSMAFNLLGMPTFAQSEDGTLYGNKSEEDLGQEKTIITESLDTEKKMLEEQKSFEGVNINQKEESLGYEPVGGKRINGKTYWDDGIAYDNNYVHSWTKDYRDAYNQGYFYGLFDKTDINTNKMKNGDNNNLVFPLFYESQNNEKLNRQIMDFFGVDTIEEVNTIEMKNPERFQEDIIDTVKLDPETTTSIQNILLLGYSEDQNISYKHGSSHFFMGKLDSYLITQNRIIRYLEEKKIITNFDDTIDENGNELGFKYKTYNKGKGISGYNLLQEMYQDDLTIKLKDYDYNKGEVVEGTTLREVGNNYVIDLKLSIPSGTVETGGEHSLYAKADIKLNQDIEGATVEITPIVTPLDNGDYLRSGGNLQWILKEKGNPQEISTTNKVDVRQGEIITLSIPKSSLKGLENKKIELIATGGPMAPTFELKRVGPTFDGKPIYAGYFLELTGREQVISTAIKELELGFVDYNGNGNSGGTVPKDENIYLTNANATVLGNTGNLVKTGYAFKGWNTKVDGKGTTYQPGSTFIITGKTTLYALWEKDSVISGGSITIKPKDIDHIAYIQGYPDKTVRPNNTITKAEVITTFDRLFKLDGSFKELPYKDLNKTWYQDQIQRAYNTGLIEKSENFNPDQPILRSEVLAMLKKVENLGNKELFQGYEDGTLRLEQTMTRAEFVKSINNVLGRKCDLNNENPYTDMKKSDWFYKDIIEASFTHKAK